jgi:hypothetical protein
MCCSQLATERDFGSGYAFEQVQVLAQVIWNKLQEVLRQKI